MSDDKTLTSLYRPHQNDENFHRYFKLIDMDLKM